MFSQSADFWDSQLLQAIQRKDLAAVQQQLAAGADPSTRDRLGLPALHVAAESGQGPIVAALLAAGADADAMPTGLFAEDDTPLLWMVARVSSTRHDDEIDSTIWPNVECSEGGHTRRIHKCSQCCEQRAEVVQQLVAAGARVDVPNTTEGPCEDQYTPLHYAAQAGCSTLVAALLQAGADPGYTTPKRYTLLHAAVDSGSREVVQQALGALGSSRVAEVLGSRPGAEAVPPLHSAACSGYLEVAEALVAAGADKEEQNEVGMTALHMALARGQCHLVPLLVTPGIVNQQYSSGATKLFYTCLTGDTPLHQAVVRPWSQQLDMNSGPEYQAMVTAAQQAVAALLTAGADTSAKDKEGHTPLAVAAAQGKPEVMEVLLKHVLQQYTAELQSQQQQGHDYMRMLQKASAMSVVHGSNTWQVFLPMVADTLGEEGVRSMWYGDEQQQPQHQQPDEEEGGISDPYKAGRIVSTMLRCWTAAWDNLATQRRQLTGRLEQLVTRPHQQQQQQQQQQLWSSGGPGSASKRPRLARELRSLSEGPATATKAAAAAAAAAGAGHLTAMAAWGSDNSSSGSSSRAARARARHTAAAASHMTQLKAAAASGSEQGVHAALAQLPDMLQGLSAAAGAAGGAGHWGLFMKLLGEMAMLGETKRQKVQRLCAQGDTAALLSSYVHICFSAGLDEDTAVDGGDALMADWLALRQQAVRELREAVVAAAEAAVSEALPLMGRNRLAWYL